MLNKHRLEKENFLFLLRQSDTTRYALKIFQLSDSNRKRKQQRNNNKKKCIKRQYYFLFIPLKKIKIKICFIVNVSHIHQVSYPSIEPHSSVQQTHQCSWFSFLLFVSNSHFVIHSINLFILRCKCCFSI